MERAGHGRPDVTKEIVTKMNSSNPLETARNLYFSGKFSEAVEIWSEMSEKGDIEAKAWLGSCYANGDGVGLDDSIALGFFEEAATGGNALAQANAGAFHFMGRGTSKNTEKAVKWLEMAAANNDLNGLFNLAQIYYKDGYNVVIFSRRNDRSWNETKEWLRKYDVPHHLLVMRPDKFKSKSSPVADGNPATGDMRYMPDEILKKKMLDEFVDIDDVLFVVDDRNKVVDMWRDLGLVVLQPAPGNF